MGTHTHLLANECVSPFSQRSVPGPQSAPRAGPKARARLAVAPEMTIEKATQESQEIERHDRLGGILTAMSGFETRASQADGTRSVVCRAGWRLAGSPA